MCTSKLNLGDGGSVGKGVGKGSHDRYIGKSGLGVGGLGLFGVGGSGMFGVGGSGIGGLGVGGSAVEGLGSSGVGGEFLEGHVGRMVGRFEGIAQHFGHDIHECAHG